MASHAPSIHPARRTIDPAENAGYCTPAATRAWLAVGGLTFVLSFSFFVPWKPYFIATVGIDDSWMLALNALFARHPRFGHDIIFTYGPWGFLHTGVYHPDTYPLMLLGWTFFATAFWAGCWSVGRRRISNPAIMLLWMPAALGVAALSVFHQNATLLCMIALMLVHYFDGNKSRPGTATSILLAAAVALASLVKFTYFAAACMVILPITIDQFRRKRLPVTLAWFGMFFVAFDLLAGQRLSDLSDYLRTSMEITGGYTDAMSFTSAWAPQGGLHRIPATDLIGFLAASGLLAAVVGVMLWKRVGAPAFLFLAALGGVLFTTFKWGFVRHDPMHAPLAAFVLLFLALLCAAALWPKDKRGTSRWALTMSLLAALAAAWNAPHTGSGRTLGPFYINSLMGEVIPNFRAAAVLATGRSDYRRKYQEALAAIRADSPVPALSGSVDVYPWSPSIAIAAGLNYQPRPVIQSYSAYTNDLAERNAAYLRGTNAPDNVLLEIADGGFPLDRFPTADDGLSWPELITRYNVDRVVDHLLVLRRVKHPRHFKLVPIEDATALLNESIPVPSADDGPIWVEIRPEPTLTGKLLTVLFKASELHLTVQTRDGKASNYRLCTASAISGFLLSPVIRDDKAYRQLAGNETKPGNLVTSIRLSESGWIGPGWSYLPEARVSFYRLKILAAQ